MNTLNFFPSAALIVFLALCPVTSGDPQANLLNVGCSQYNASDPSVFSANLNATLADLQSALSTSGGSFATAEMPRGVDGSYALVQCRDYLSMADCLACFSTAEALLRRRCGMANGARAIYDGCFLRYESAPFFDQGTLPGNTAICSSAAGNASGLSSTAEGLVTDLSAATPRTPGFWAAAAMDGIFGVAQCVETVSEDVCAQCLEVALGNIRACPPSADGRAVDAGCFMRYSTQAFFPANQTMDLARFLGSGSSKKGRIIGGVVGGVGGLMLLVAIAMLLWIRRSREHPRSQSQRGHILEATELRGPLNFNYKDLKRATKNFSEENKLGEGGFGEVYKGILDNGKVIAVKKLVVAQASRVEKDFQSEVKLISNVHHRNLVRLLGCSSKGSDLLLVYEYMGNSSLDKFLFGDRRGFLNWKQRFDIIVGMARGLAYLHQEFYLCIIHRDIKSSNILLDEDFQPKIADFGLARLLPSDQSQLSSKFAGTLGYTAPEYAIYGQLSEKVDTYSYGIVVLEIVSGRRSNDMDLEPSCQYLLELVWRLYEENRLLDMVDKSLDPAEYEHEEVKRVIEIALLCTQSLVAARPTMSEIVVMLMSKGLMLQNPTRPTYIDATSRIYGDTLSYIVTTPSPSDKDYTL